jgi:hypothetical protein
LVSGGIGVEGGEMRIEDDASASEMVEDIGDDGVTFLEETMDLGVLNGEADLLEHVED